jgi:hypothetical protein
MNHELHVELVEEMGIPLALHQPVEEFLDVAMVVFQQLDCVQECLLVMEEQQPDDQQHDDHAHDAEMRAIPVHQSTSQSGLFESLIVKLSGSSLCEQAQARGLDGGIPGGGRSELDFR